MTPGKGEIDYDSRIDYRSFYSRHLERLNGSGDKLTAQCPFSEHTNKGAFSIDAAKGTWKCWVCERTGNAWTFLQEAVGMTEDAAREHMRGLAGVTDLASRRPAAKRAKYTVEEYAKAKHLPLEFLNDLGVTNERGSVAIAYRDEHGGDGRPRKRHAQGAGPRFTWGKGTTPILPYGLWRLPELRAADERRIILMEGESDTQTLWHRGVANVFGIPGAQMMKPEWCEYFKHFDEILIHVEPGDGGQQFRNRTAEILVRGGYGGKLLAFSVRGAKDPSDLHVAEEGKDPDRFMAIWQSSVEAAQAVDITSLAPDLNGILPGCPLKKFDVPEGFTVGDTGINAVVMVKGEQAEVRVSAVPMVISKRLRSIDTGEEKIQLAYQRDGEWQTITTERPTAFSSRNIVELSSRGLPITSERARHVVKYLGDFEDANLATLPIAASVERMGWVGHAKFLPGLAGDVTLDPAPGSEGLAMAYHEHGTLDDWKVVAGPIRDRWPLARFMLAASFAAPMLKQLRQRVFIVHFWGASRGGKTAALKLALSAWGEPEELMATFNSTKVGMERLAGFYNDLPLGVDERQVIGADQGLAEGLVYLLGAGKGKVRGSKGGGLQHTATWRTIALTTGEEPLSRATSHTGVKTRSLEVYGTPIGDETAARKIHQGVGDHYGIAGPAFVRKLIEHGAAVEIDHADIAQRLENRTEGNLPSHLQAAATVALADEYISRWLYGVEEVAARREALKLGEEILGQLETATEADYAERADQWVQGWLGMNRARFQGTSESEASRQEPWGFISDNAGSKMGDGDTGTTWVLPHVLDEALREAGYASRRVLRDMAQAGALVTTQQGGETRHTKKHTWQARRVNMVGIKPATGTPGRDRDSTGTAQPVLKGLETVGIEDEI